MSVRVPAEPERERVVSPGGRSTPAPAPLPAAITAAGNHALARRLQRATQVNPRTLQPAHGPSNPLLSETGAYMLTASGDLFSRHDAAAPRMCTSRGGDSFGPRGREVPYIRWMHARHFITDCLHVAEEIMHQAQFDVNAPAVRSRVRTGAGAADYAAFGATDPANVNAAQAASAYSHAPGALRRVNAGAMPGLGEAFVIVETGAVQEYPYHAAGVIAVDGNDAITLEMFAGDVDADDANRTVPTFHMYGPGDAQTFHATWAALFTNPVTVAIEVP